MGALYNSLNFPPSLNDKVEKFDEKTKSHMAGIKITSNNEYSDVLNNRVNGYYVNPVGDSCNTISSICNQIITIVGAPSSINVAANNLIRPTYDFFRHTQRLSGIEAIGEEDALGKPTLDFAINTGRQLSYILFQTEGIDDNSVILGSFSSLYTKPDLTNYITTISTYPTTIQNSIVSTYYSDPDGGFGGYTYSSNLTSGQITHITSTLNDIQNFINYKRTSDENFFTKSQDIVNKFSAAGSITERGSVHKQLVNDVIGTNLGKSRVNT
jgi:hypothetical protein